MSALWTLVRLARFSARQRWLSCHCGSRDIEARPDDYACRACGRVDLTLKELP